MRDTGILFSRLMKHILRSPDTIITVLIMPIMIMVLFVYVFGGAIATGMENYVDYMVPGIILMAVASGVAYTAVRLFTDVQQGLFQRFHSMPISRSSLLWSHVLTSLVSNVISVVVIIGVALIMGFRPHAGFVQWLGVAGLVCAFILALTWVAVIPGLLAKTVDGASAFSYPLIFLPFISSAFVPTESMPGPVRAFAEHQPVTSLVNGMRSLLYSQPAEGQVWWALGWCCVIAVVAYAGAMVAYRRLA